MADTGNVLDMIAHPVVADPLAALQRGLQTREIANRNALFQAKQATGQAFQNSLNPDGTPNQAALNQNLAAAGPVAALNAQESSQAGQTLDQGTLLTHMARLTSLGNAAMGLASQYPTGVPQDAVNKEIDTQAAKLGLSPEDVAQAKAQFGADPAANTKTIFRNHAANLSAQQALLAALPQTADLNTGSAVVGTQRPAALSGQPQGAIIPQGAPLPLTLTPGEATAPTQIGVTPGTNKPIYGTRTQFNEKATGQPSPLGTGRINPPSALLNPANAPAATPAVPSAAPTASSPAPAGGGIVMGPGPAEQAAQTASGTQSATAFQGIADQGVKGQSQNAILGNMLADSKQFTTGPLADRIKAFTSFATTYAPKTAAAFGVKPESVAANESFNKLAAQLADAQGAGSDSRLAVNIDANPHVQMAPASVDLVIRQLQGNADYAQVRAKLAASYPDKSDQAGFDADLRQKLDPRAFQYARMTPEQRKTYADSLSTQDKETVRSSYNYAHKAGLLGGN
jgi:hypothetical protein